MPRDDRRQHPLDRLTKPESDLGPPNDEGRAPMTILEQLFPRDTDAQMTALFGFAEKRNAMRMRTGQSRIPPRIHEKVEAQIALRRQLASDILDAIERAEAAGIHVTVTRHTLQSILESEELDRDDPTL